MDRFDVLGEDLARLTGATGAILDDAPDDELQALVTSAAIAAEAPIALVSMVLRRTQVFRAHVGLPPDLAVTRATDRCASFCQLVVRDRAPLQVDDATTDPRVPQELVKRYGLRAYLGVPLVVHGAVLGTLCLLDTRPRSFTTEQRMAIERLGRAVTTRLVELGAEPVIPATASGELAPALAVAQGAAAAARVATTEVRALHRALASGGGDAVQVLRDAARALEDLDDALATIEDRLRAAARARR